MPSPPRLLFPKTTVFITTRIEEGLPLIAAAFMNRILEGSKEERLQSRAAPRSRK